MTPSAPTARLGASPGRVKALARHPLVSVSLFGGLVFVAGATQISGLASTRTIRSLLVLAALLGMASVGQTLAAVLGGIDLSIPFLIGVANVVGAEAFGAGWPWPLVVLVAIGVCAMVGAANGFLSWRFSVHPLIITLGMGSAATAAVLWWTHGFPSGSVPRGLTSFVSIAGTTGPLQIPPVVVLWLGVAALVLLVERRSVYGRQLHALGSNPPAAELALVSARRVWTTTFALSAGFAGLTGLLLLGFTGQASGTVGDPYLFQTIAAVVVGGTALTGGSGGYLQTAVGAITLTVLATVLTGLGVTSTLLQVALGGLILLAAAIYAREPHPRDRL